MKRKYNIEYADNGIIIRDLDIKDCVQDIKSTLSNADSPNQEEDKMQKVVGAISNDVKAIYYEMTKFSKAYHV